jgi:acetyltransferase
LPVTIRNLDYVNHPKSIAVIGASVRAGSVGRVVMNNILDGGFEGEVWPVNPKYGQIVGRDCYSKIKDIPGVPDVAVIITPPATVPALISELGEKGTRVAVVITAGLTSENGLRQAMLDAAKPFLLRIIGPNTVGLMVPPAKLNASFAHMGANPGGIALLSQSGAIATALVDWAADNHVGFSQIVSLGDMADVDVGDCLDLLAGDAKTRAILMYLESIPNPRKFMSAARAAARLKPVIAIKSGRHTEAAKAAATHTGALSGADRVIDAALHRAGILRVQGLAELFDAAETIARFAPLERARTSIVTNGGGAGVLAVDRLMDCGGELAVLTTATISDLDKLLPANWSHANPVDIIGDATPERYRAAVEAVAADPETDVIMVLNCPTGLASPVEAAAAVAALSKDGTINGKPVLTCWLGEHTAREGRRVLQEAGVTSYETPSDAAVAVSYLSDWSRAQKALMRVPPARGEDVTADRDAVAAIFRQAAKEGRGMLTEPEAKAAITAYGIPVPETVIARSVEEVEMAAARLLQSCEKVVVKLLSKTLTHKSDIGGVVLDLGAPAGAREAAAGILARLKKIAPQADMEGFVVQPMIVRSHAQELILGVSRDPIFGPVILFGAGGVAVEVMDDTAIALPPLDDVLAGDLIDRTRIAQLLAGFRDRKPADRKAICLALNGLSQMIVDFPCIVAMDINPLIADSEGVVALDARIQIDPADVERPGPNPEMAIRPYPSGWTKDVVLAKEAFLLRPIRPADISLYPAFLANVTADDMRLRFFSKAKSIPHQLLLRLTQLDYNRDMAFLALEKESGELAGIVRLSSDPDHQVAEYGLLVRSDLKGHGLGWALLNHLVDYAAHDGLKRIEGIVLSENETMLTMCREFGFSVRQHPSEQGMSLAALELANRSLKQT